MTTVTNTSTWALAIPAPLPMKSSNSRENWRAVARYRKTWRETAYWHAAGLRLPRGLRKVRIEVTLHFNANRRRDAPNYYSEVIKPCVDALGPARQVRSPKGVRTEPGWGLIPDDTAEYLDLAAPVIGAPVAKGLHPHGLVVLAITNLTGDLS